MCGVMVNHHFKNPTEDSSSQSSSPPEADASQLPSAAYCLLFIFAASPELLTFDKASFPIISTAENPDALSATGQMNIVRQNSGT